MKSGGVKIRCMNVGCNHQIALPNGKVILIDPFFPETLPKECRKESVQAADYILLTHSHFDHDAETGYFVETYGAKVFCGFMSARAVLEYHKIPFDNMIPVFPGQTYDMDGFAVEVSQAKHNEMQGKTYDPTLDLALRMGGRQGHNECDTFGSLESMDYRIITDTGFCIAVISGIPMWKNGILRCREQKNHVVLRQATMREEGRQVSPEKLARLFVQYKSPLVIPFHTENVKKRLSDITVEEYFDQVDKCARKLDPQCHVMYPETGKWYDL